MSKADFRSFIPPPSAEKIAGPTPRAHTEARLHSQRAQELFGTWAKLFAKPFKGITTDGTVLPGLFKLRAEQAPTEAIAVAASNLLQCLTPEEKRRSCLPVDSEQWRNWQNTEMLVENFGLRLDEVSPTVRDGVLAVLKASLSSQGYEAARNVMKLNAFLGMLVNGPGVMGEWSYTFCLYGEPSTIQPWGWQFFGHHLCFHCFLLGTQMTLTPTFLGAEPCYADEGPFAGITMFQDEEREGLSLMQGLSREQQEQAIVAHAMVGGDLPPGRRHFADNLHLGGAHQDNRVIPYEGLVVSGMTSLQQRRLLDLVERYLEPLPAGPRAFRMGDVEAHLNTTHFCWIGGTAADSPFYYRIQSPVIMVEFDHHAGVFLTNPEPAKFHVHTIVRTPNGNDYGRDLLRQHYETSPHHKGHHHHAHAPDPKKHR